MIPNFCLDSQPSGIPLILHGLHFGFQPIEAPSIVSQFFFLTHVLHTSLSLSLSLSFFSSPFLLFCRYGYKRSFGFFFHLLCPSTFTSLAFLGTSFEMSWALKHTLSFWVALWKPTFNGSWNGGISQAWFTIAARTIV